MIKAIFFDRDGTLGELQDVKFPNSFRPFGDIKSFFDRLKNKGYKTGILSNQSSIARGTGKGYDFDAEFRMYGADVWKICPHDETDRCSCRKPKSGLFLAAAKELSLSPDECLLIGDRLSDVLCAKNVRGQAALVLTGKGKEELAKAKQVFPDLCILNSYKEILERL